MGPACLARVYSGALARHTLPATIALNPNVGVAQRQLSPLSLPHADKVEREPHHGRVLVDPHREVVLHGRYHLLVELGHESQFSGFVSSGAIVVGHDEFVCKEVGDKVGVLPINSVVPASLKFDQNLLVRLDRLRAGCRQ